MKVHDSPCLTGVEGQVRTLCRLLLLLLLLTPAALAQTLSEGSPLPRLPGPDFSQLAGPKGLVLVVFRSADW